MRAVEPAPAAPFARLDPCTRRGRRGVTGVRGVVRACQWVPSCCIRPPNADLTGVQPAWTRV